MYDFHMHSHFSEDCSIPMEDMVKGAIEKGLKTICFTDHIDYDYPDDDFTFGIDLDEYDLTIKALQEKYANHIRILKGIEIGVQPHVLHRYETLMDEVDFDFIICSMHATDKKGLHDGDFFAGKTSDEAYEIYYEELLYCVKNFKRFNVLGHLDLVKRYTINNEAQNPFHEVISEIFKEIIPAGQGIEINTSGKRYGMDHAMPSQDILKLYKDHGGEIITLGSDAHRPEDLGFDFKDSLQLLDSIGFKYVTTFEKQEPTFHSIRGLL